MAEATGQMAEAFRGEIHQSVDKKARVSIPAAFRKALLTSEIPTVRGKFKFGANQHPVQDWYALTAEKGADGKMVLKTEKKVLTDHGDVYASECKMAKD